MAIFNSYVKLPEGIYNVIANPRCPGKKNLHSVYPEKKKKKHWQRGKNLSETVANKVLPIELNVELAHKDLKTEEVVSTSWPVICSKIGNPSNASDDIVWMVADTLTPDLYPTGSRHRPPIDKFTSQNFGSEGSSYLEQRLWSLELHPSSATWLLISRSSESDLLVISIYPLVN